MKTIALRLKDTESLSYDIGIGYEIRERLGAILAAMAIAKRYVVLADSTVASIYGQSLIENLQQAHLPVEMIAFPAGEASKNIKTALAVVGQLLRAGVDRKTALIALGGGVTGDLTGFVASLYMRSVPYLQIPTTLVGQVDSSIGGKTAIDLEEGKNLLGTFYQPRAVLIDPSFLDTLPAEEFRNGLAEVVKYGIIEGEELFALLAQEMTALKEKQRGVLPLIVERCCRIKARLVEIDERDQGPRHFLNFGHTLGHALEAASDYGLPHGSGVSLGMLAAVRISEKISGLSDHERQRIEDLITETGLPTSIPEHMDTELILSKLGADKKKSGKTINFVLIRKIGEPFLTGDVGEDILRATIEGLKR